MKVYKHHKPTGNDVYILLFGSIWILCMDDCPLNEPEKAFSLPEEAVEQPRHSKTYQIAATRYVTEKLNADCVRAAFFFSPSYFEGFIENYYGYHSVKIDENGDVAIRQEKSSRPRWLSDHELIAIAQIIEAETGRRLADIALD